METSTLPPALGTLGERIAQARTWRADKISQVEMALALGIDRKTLSSWENNHTQPTIDQLLDIQELTGFPATWFVDGLKSDHHNPHGGGDLANPGGSPVTIGYQNVIPMMIAA